MWNVVWGKVELYNKGHDDDDDADTQAENKMNLLGTETRSFKTMYCRKMYVIVRKDPQTRCVMYFKVVVCFFCALSYR